MPDSIVIDPRLSRLIPPLNSDELAQLEANILAEGCRDALVAGAWPPEYDCPECHLTRDWKPAEWTEYPQGHRYYTTSCCHYTDRVPWVLLDGHNRRRICEKHGTPYRVIKIDLPSREAAEDWIDANQLGRRNLTPEAMSLLRGRRYNRLKKAVGQRGHEKIDQNDPSSTAEALASQYGVSAPTIKRDGQFAQAVETLEPHVPDIAERVMAGDIPSKQAVIEAAREPEKRDVIAAKWTRDPESYTPALYTEAARAVMGSIDCDPASNDEAQKTVKAKVYYTPETDGLKHEWNGNVFLNPPYSHPEVANFINKLLRELKDGQQAILLTNNNTDTAFFHKAASAAAAVCFTKGRINFLKPDGSASSPTNGQAFYYFGNNVERFREVFGAFGILMARL